MAQDTAQDPWMSERALLAETVSMVTELRDPRILAAIASVPRHLFIPEAQRKYAYEDRALPLSEEQTISQPSMIAIMLAELDCSPTDRVLEVGAGSGYAAALLGQLAKEVHAIEIRAGLARGAQKIIEELGYDNVHVHVGDGSHGLREHAPYDRILVSAGAVQIPEPLIAQLMPGGRIAIPVGGDFGQSLMVGVKATDGTMHWRRSTACIFVPLVTDEELNQTDDEPKLTERAARWRPF